MKRVCLLLLSCLFLFGAGCARDMNWVISNEPSVRGIVEQIGEDQVLIRVSQADDPAYAPGELVRADKETRLQDCKFSAQVGDEVMVYYDDDIQHNAAPGGYPAIHDVHGYVLVTPINRGNEE